jgi:hypothetical protein
MAWNERGNVCGVASEEVKAKAALVVAPKAAAKAGKTEPKVEAAKPSPKKKRHTHRCRAQAQSAQPVERRLFRLFRNQNRSGGGT